LPLFIRNRRTQVLDFRHSLTDEHNLRDIGNAANPGIADQLWVER
jgi:hypothetical protein